MRETEALYTAGHYGDSRKTLTQYDAHDTGTESEALRSACPQNSNLLRQSHIAQAGLKPHPPVLECWKSTHLAPSKPAENFANKASEGQTT